MNRDQRIQLDDRGVAWLWTRLGEPVEKAPPELLQLQARLRCITIAGISVVVFAGIVFAVMAWPAGATSNDVRLVFASILVTVGASVSIIEGMRKKLHGADERRGVLKSRRCALCFTDLQSRNPEYDDCTTCPGCGAAWKLPLAESHED